MFVSLTGFDTVCSYDGERAAVGARLGGRTCQRLRGCYRVRAGSRDQADGGEVLARAGEGGIRTQEFRAIPRCDRSGSVGLTLLVPLIPRKTPIIPKMKADDRYVLAKASQLCGVRSDELKIRGCLRHTAGISVCYSPSRAINESTQFSRLNPTILDEFGCVHIEFFTSWANLHGRKWSPSKDFEGDKDSAQSRSSGLYACRESI